MKDKSKIGHCWVMAGLLLALSLSAGCRKRTPRTGELPVSTDNPTASASTQAANPATLAIPRVVEELNYALQDYRERTGKMPKSLQELLTAAKLPPPQLPPGAQLRINQQFKTIEFVPPGGR